jgi:hypothetical protein
MPGAPHKEPGITLAFLYVKRLAKGLIIWDTAVTGTKRSEVAKWASIIFRSM